MWLPHLWRISGLGNSNSQPKRFGNQMRESSVFGNSCNTSGSYPHWKRAHVPLQSRGANYSQPKTTLPTKIDGRSINARVKLDSKLSNSKQNNNNNNNNNHNHNHKCKQQLIADSANKYSIKVCRFGMYTSNTCNRRSKSHDSYKIRIGVPSKCHSLELLLWHMQFNLIGDRHLIMPSNSWWDCPTTGIAQSSSDMFNSIW